MLKLLIIDDEKIICETIANLVDWAALDIELIGTCSDGVEAYHMILDELPDIVMTDIQMPGINGLELIERIGQTDLSVHFIILSGYNEFEYAKRAMKSGIRHYLLKPCDEDQIIECIKEVKKDCQHDLLFKQVQKNMFQSLQPVILQNLISKGCTMPQAAESFFEPFEQYISLYDVPYQLCYVYYLEEKDLEVYLNSIDSFFYKQAPQLQLNKIYVTNVLLLFFPLYDSGWEEGDKFFSHLPGCGLPGLEYELASFPNIVSLLECLIQKLKRYDKFYFIDKNQLNPQFNYQGPIQQCNHLIDLLLSAPPSGSDYIYDEYQKLFETISDRSFLIQLANNILITLSTKLPDSSPTDVVDFLSLLHTYESIDEIRTMTLNKVSSLVKIHAVDTGHCSFFIDKTIRYLEEHFSDSNLTLKWIAENYLYMNVNYVSRCFQKETGQKFSAYLVNLRVQKAKEILSANDSEKIKNIAELVGCGNNPYYFSKIFKKCTGMTPSAYTRRVRG